MLSRSHPSFGIIIREHVHHNPKPYLSHQAKPLLSKRRLLEDLAVGELVRLAVNDKGLVPRPLVLDELAVLGVLGVQLGEGVALVVWGDIESRESLLATDKEGPLDDGVVVRAIDGSTAEEVLAASLETGEETA